MQLTYIPHTSHNYVVGGKVPDKMYIENHDIKSPCRKVGKSNTLFNTISSYTLSEKSMYQWNLKTNL